jgi:hypothetical protein
MTWDIEVEPDPVETGYRYILNGIVSEELFADAATARACAQLLVDAYRNWVNQADAAAARTAA